MSPSSPSSECQSKIDQYQGFQGHIAFIDVPNLLGISDHYDSFGVWQRLDTSFKWFVKTPLEIQLEDGIVINVEAD